MSRQIVETALRLGTCWRIQVAQPMRIIASRIEFNKATGMHDIVVIAEPPHPQPYVPIYTKNKDAEEPHQQRLKDA